MNKKKDKGVRKGSVIERDIEIVRGMEELGRCPDCKEGTIFLLMYATDPGSGQLLSGCCGAPPYMVREAVEDEERQRLESEKHG